MIHPSLKTSAALVASFATTHQSVTARKLASLEEALQKHPTLPDTSQVDGPEESKGSKLMAAGLEFEAKWSKFMATDKFDNIFYSDSDESDGIDAVVSASDDGRELLRLAAAQGDFTDSESDERDEIGAPASSAAVNRGFLRRLSWRKSGAKNLEKATNPTSMRTRGSFLGGLLWTAKKVAGAIPKQKMVSVKLHTMDGLGLNTMHGNDIAPLELPARTRVRTLYSIVKKRGVEDAALFVKDGEEQQLDLYSRRTLGHYTDAAGPNELNVFVLQRDRRAELEAAVAEANTPAIIRSMGSSVLWRLQYGISAMGSSAPGEYVINSWYFKLSSEFDKSRRRATNVEVRFDESGLRVGGRRTFPDQPDQIISWESDWDSTWLNFSKSEGTFEFQRVGKYETLKLELTGLIRAHGVSFEQWCALFSKLAQRSRDRDAGEHSREPLLRWRNL